MRSRYNLCLPLGGAGEPFLLANGLTGAVDLCPPDLANALSSGGECALPEAVRAKLRLRGYLTDADEAEKLDTLSGLLRRLEEKTLLVVFVPTYNCNFRCVYCFERALQRRGAEKLGRVMSEKSVEAVFRALDQRPAGERQRIVLMGGEPLLPGNRAALEAIGKNAALRGIEIELCVSNGYYLDEYIDFLLESRVRAVQITLDGPQALHDARRFLASGEGTFERVARNVGLALKRGLTVHLRVNVSTGTQPYEALCEEAKARGWTGYAGYSLHAVGVQYCEGVDEAAKEYAAAPDEAVDALTSGRAELRKAFSARAFYPLRPRFCAAAGSCVAVDAFGDLYACWSNALGNPERAIGRLDEQNGAFAFDERARAWAELRPDCREECRACPYLFLCGGGCPMDRACGCSCEREKRRVEADLVALGREFWAGREISRTEPLTRSYEEVWSLLDEAELDRLRAGGLPAKLKWLFIS